jgi:hypothetical protein
VESKKHGETDFERHQIVVFQEDLEEFLHALCTSVKVMKANEPKKGGAVFTRLRAGDESSSGGFHRDPAAG